MSAYSSSDGVSFSGLADSLPANTPPASVAPATRSSATSQRERCELARPTWESPFWHAAQSKSRRPRSKRRKIALRETEHVRFHWNARIDPDFRGGPSGLRSQEVAGAREVPGKGPGRVQESLRRPEKDDRGR